MTAKILKRNKRLLSRKQMAHKPSGRGTGKWQDRTTLWNYKMKSRRLRRIAAESRRRNRGL